MADNDIRKVCAELMGAFNASDVDRSRSLYLEDSVLYEAPTKRTLVGLDPILKRSRNFTQTFEDAQVKVRELHIAGDTAIVEFSLSGTHTGPIFDIEPTGRRINIDSCLSLKIKDGKIMKHTTYLDMATILRDLGLITMPGDREAAA